MKYLLPFIFTFLILSLASAETKTVCIKNTRVEAEIADTLKKRQQGLMFRKSLKDNQAMLFIFPKEARYSFWMKGMQIALDIVWIDARGKIVDLKRNIPACDYSCPGLVPRAKAQYVLEVKAGFCEKNKIKVGDKVNF